MSRPRSPSSLLLVEDDEAVASALQQLLGWRGYATTWVSTVAGALDALDTESFAAVLTDNDLPDGTGLEVLRRAGGAGVVSVFMSGSVSLSLEVAALTAGAVAVLRKPFTVDAVIEHLPSLPPTTADPRRAAAGRCALREARIPSAGDR